MDLYKPTPTYLYGINKVWGCGDTFVGTYSSFMYGLTFIN